MVVICSQDESVLPTTSFLASCPMDSEKHFGKMLTSDVASELGALKTTINCLFVLGIAAYRYLSSVT